MKTKKRSEWQVGESPVLHEDGGSAVVTIIGKVSGVDWCAFRVRFNRIIVQFPYVPYFPGDEVDIGVNPNYEDSVYANWSFEAQSEETA